MWRIEAGVRSCCAPGRRLNEDAATVGGLLLGADSGFGVTVLVGAGVPFVAIVADGMGGHAAGHRASRLVAECLARDRRLVASPPEVGPAIAAAHEALYAAMDDDAALTGMGTTVVGLCVSARGAATVFNVGDSRLLVRDEELGIVQFSVDHAERSGHGTAPALTQCLGGTSTRVGVTPHVTGLELRAQDRLLLCSDGLTDLVGDDAIAAQLGRRAPCADVAHALVQAARHAGATDDVTAVVLDVFAET